MYALQVETTKLSIIAAPPGPPDLVLGEGFSSKGVPSPGAILQAEIQRLPMELLHHIPSFLPSRPFFFTMKMSAGLKAAVAVSLPKI